MGAHNQMKAYFMFVLMGYGVPCVINTGAFKIQKLLAMNLVTLLMVNFIVKISKSEYYLSTVR